MRPLVFYFFVLVALLLTFLLLALCNEAGSDARSPASASTNNECAQRALQPTRTSWLRS